MNAFSRLGGHRTHDNFRLLRHKVGEDEVADGGGLEDCLIAKQDGLHLNFSGALFPKKSRKSPNSYQMANASLPSRWTTKGRAI